MQLLVLQVEEQCYAVPLEDVGEVVRAVAVTRLSGAPGVVEGIINVRGSLVPVLSMRRRFRLPQRAVAPSDQYVLAWTGERTVALHVDGVARIEESEVADLDGAREVTQSALYVAGVAKLPDGLVLISDLHAFLSQAEAETLEEALAASAASHPGPG